MEGLWLMLATTLYNVFLHCLQILVSKKQDMSERWTILASSNLVRNLLLNAEPQWLLHCVCVQTTKWLCLALGLVLKQIPWVSPYPQRVEGLHPHLGIFKLTLLGVAALHISMPKYRLSLQVPRKYFMSAFSRFPLPWISQGSWCSDLSDLVFISCQDKFG